METDGNREKTKKCGERKNAAKQMNINKNVTERKKTPAHVRTNRLDFADEKKCIEIRLRHTATSVKIYYISNKKPLKKAPKT